MLATLLLGFLCLLGASAPAFAAQSLETVGGGATVQVLTSDQQQLQFSLPKLSHSWVPREFPAEGMTLYDLQVDGFITAGEPGRPRVPQSGGWIVVPPGTRPELKILSESWTDARSRSLMVQGVPILVPGEDDMPGTASEILVLPGQDIPADAPIPTAIREKLGRPAQGRQGGAVTLGPVTWWRGHRVVSYTVVPVRHDPIGRASQVLESGSWEVQFVAEKSAATEIPARQRRKTHTRGDDRFGGTFLNHTLLGTLPTEAAYRGITVDRSLDKDRGGKSGTLLGNLEGRLGVTKTGLFKVSYARLRQLSLLPDVDIAESEIRLYQRRYLKRLDDGSGQAPYVEIEVPLHMVGEGNDFDGDDYFLFYGLRLRDDQEFTVDLGQGPELLQGSGDPHEMNNPANIYWLAASEPEAGQPWARMSTATLPAASTTPLATYRRTEHHEEQLSFRELQPNTGFDRVFFNNSNDTQVNIGFNPLWSPDPDGAPVDILLGFTGKNDVIRPLEFHLVNADNEETFLGNYDVSSLYLSQRPTTAPAAAFAGPNAKVRMGPRGGDSSDRVYAFINWIKLSYDAFYQAVGGRLEFHTGEGAGPRPIEVTGFTSSDLGLVDVQDPRNPVWINLSAANVLTDGAGWKLSIEPDNPTAAPRTFYAAQDLDGAVVPEFTYSKSTVARDQINPTELAGTQPDLVVITHDEFDEALTGWINHRVARAGGDLNVHVVLVDDLFDWYSGGLRDAWALKRFSEHAINTWGTWALTLVGDANENVLELDVLTSARDWSTDWVPTHYHVQDTGIYNPELMASDKWYATSQSGQTYPVEDFPEFTISPWEMYVGRLPVNSVEELNTMVSKIQAMESLEAGQTWRQRGIFFADDAWSNGYGANAFNYFTYRAYEEDFARSERDSLAPSWASGSPVSLQSVELYLADYLDPYWEDMGMADRPSALFKDYAESDANPPLLAALSQGGIVAHYQGHGNPYVLSSEYWMEDRLGFYRKDVSNLNNANKPWVFFGMGCHISDWAQNPVYTQGTPRERSLSEKMMVRSGGGASATYGSSGYEYIDANRIFGEYIFRRWMRHPPVARSVGQPDEHRSRWMLGELMWAAEADLLAVLGGGSTFREMVAQYTLLGDPLMMLDAGAPQVTAELLGTGGGPLTGEADLVAIDPSNQRVIEINARDEAGIDRLEVVDDQGNDLTSQMVLAEMLPGATDHQEMNYTLTVPIVPRDQVLTVRVHDTAGPLPTDRHYELVLNLPQEVEFQAGGEVIDPATYVFAPDEPVAFTATVSASTWFHEGQALDLTSPNLDLSDVSFDLGKSNELTFSFTAEAPAGTSGDRSVTLVVDTYETVYTLQEAGAQLPQSTITAVFNYPNPMREETRFLFESGASGGDGLIRVYSTSGRHVAQIPFGFAGGGSGVINWDGRDSDGDELANGTYLYRIEMDTPAGHIVSDMQRLVVMR